MTDTPWIKFTRRQAKQTKDPVVTMQKGGMFSLNPSAYTLLGEPAAIEFFFDPEGKRIGLRPSDPAAADSYQVRQAKGVTGYLVTGQAFTKYHDINTDVARRYRPIMDGDVMVIDLADGTEVAARGKGQQVAMSPDESEGTGTLLT